jgi:hypothetical protein
MEPLRALAPAAGAKLTSTSQVAPAFSDPTHAELGVKSELVDAIVDMVSATGLWLVIANDF